MLERKYGHVFFISVATNNPHPYEGIYSATKSALEGIAETLRLETIPHIKVTLISPGITDTNFFPIKSLAVVAQKTLIGEQSLQRKSQKMFYMYGAKGLALV